MGQSLAGVFLLLQLLLQQNTAVGVLCGPTTQQAFQLEERRQSRVCCGLGRHQLNVGQGGDAEQKAATVQCHCLPYY